MPDVVTLFPQAVDTFTARVQAVAETQWSAPTPDDEWTVADLVRHLVDEHRWAPPLLRGQDLDAAGKIVAAARSLPDDGGVGANAAQEWHEASTASLDAVREPGVAEGSVALSRGATPVDQYLREMIFDLTLHSWDLQRAIGVDEEIPEQLVDFAHDLARRVGSPSGSTLFKAAIDVGDEAPAVDRLVALTGRDPKWAPPG